LHHAEAAHFKIAGRAIKVGDLATEVVQTAIRMGG
jgi:hypothetical protein